MESPSPYLPDFLDDDTKLLESLNQYFTLSEEYNKLKKEKKRMENIYKMRETQLHKKLELQQQINNQIIKTFKLKDKFKGEMCSICREEIGNKMVTNCGHVFHKNCLNESLKHNEKCPLCRETIKLSLFTYETKIFHEIVDNEQPILFHHNSEVDSTNDTLEYTISENEYESD